MISILPGDVRIDVRAMSSSRSLGKKIDAREDLVRLDQDRKRVEVTASFHMPKLQLLTCTVCTNSQHSSLPLCFLRYPHLTARHSTWMIDHIVGKPNPSWKRTQVRSFNPTTWRSFAPGPDRVLHAPQNNLLTRMFECPGLPCYPLLAIPHPSWGINRAAVSMAQEGKQGSKCVTV